MVAQYQGNAIWNCYIDNRLLVLSEAELVELQEIKFDGGLREELEDKIDDIKYEIDNLADNLDESICKIEENVEGDVFSEEDFKEELTKISEIITQMQQI